MKADAYGTHSEQMRSRHGWRNSTQRRKRGDLPCWQCRHWTGGLDSRGLCDMLDASTARNATCMSFEGRTT